MRRLLALALCFVGSLYGVADAQGLRRNPSYLPSAPQPYYDALRDPISAESALNTLTTAVSFIALGASLNHVQFYIGKTSALSPTGAIAVTLNADSGGTGSAAAPGAVISTLASLTDAQLPSSNKAYLVNVTNLNVNKLIVGQKYWLVIGKTATTKIQSYSVLASTAVAVASDHAIETNASSTWATSVSRLAACVGSGSACAARSGRVPLIVISNPGVT